jgi:hypothetical protein
VVPTASTHGQKRSLDAQPALERPQAFLRRLPTTPWQSVTAERLFAQLSGLVQPLVAAGWLPRKPGEEWDPELGTSAMVTLTRFREAFDVELFVAGWLQVYAHGVDDEPDDEPSEPAFWLEEPADLEVECRERGWAGSRTGVAYDITVSLGLLFARTWASLLL